MVLASVLAVVVLLLGHFALHAPTPAPHSITLTWQASPSREGFTIVGYNVYRREEPGSPYKRIAVQVPRTTYEDHAVMPDTNYAYAVTAVDNQGRESRFSNVAVVKIP